jgi:hypothetical protein
MWTFNVTRRLVEAAGCEPLTNLVPQDEAVMLRAGVEGLGDPATGRVRVLKMHSHLPPNLPRSRFIVPRRDVRDALVSYMRFMRYDFEQALGYVRLAIATERHYATFPRECTLPIEYTDILARPANVARAIAHFLDVQIDDRALYAIVRSYSKENVGRLIAKRERDVSRRSQDGEPIGADELVVLGPQHVRVFDTSTGFQSGHVSQYREGHWRKSLTRAQQARLEAQIADLAPETISDSDDDAAQNFPANDPAGAWDDAYRQRGFAGEAAASTEGTDASDS